MPVCMGALQLLHHPEALPQQVTPHPATAAASHCTVLPRCGPNRRHQNGRTWVWVSARRNGCRSTSYSPSMSSGATWTPGSGAEASRRAEMMNKGSLVFNLRAASWSNKLQKHTEYVKQSSGFKTQTGRFIRFSLQLMEGNYQSWFTSTFKYLYCWCFIV